MKQGPQVERYAQMVDFLVKAPRTTEEVCQELGLIEQSARRWLKALWRLGRLQKGQAPRVASGPGKAPTLWIWQG